MIYRHLNEKDRFYIEQRLSEGDSLRSIARALGFSPSTISREIKRHTPCKRRYLGRYFAHPMMQNRRAKRDDYKPSAVRVTQRYVP
ncbi:Transposase, IS30 family [Piscirickettsia salmonis]|uniref:Transposase n=1 Tax=Piscirickettsia salmonis TaxID=1238 RepID=A0A1L6TFW3_PISSA|nr:transposase [Piscirickettsia salmonis]ALT18049.1 hypothetical protein PSLF89_03430 [Piscirickettsia salmonis LF-89 = ATCC VR-1361]ALY01477.1 hypothetical protein AWE47_00130 [Piscirickettsia salmonis]AMA40991.1 hypothetical protein AWJ11_00135 [Piscirickettsia salmonis]AOS36179.1 hypothetical protein AVM72_13125 [Piscirickettsia salmonis]